MDRVYKGLLLSIPKQQFYLFIPYILNNKLLVMYMFRIDDSISYNNSYISSSVWVKYVYTSFSGFISKFLKKREVNQNY